MPPGKEPPDSQKQADPELPDRQKQDSMDPPPSHHEDVQTVMHGPGDKQQPSAEASQSADHTCLGAAGTQHVFKRSYTYYECWQGVEAVCHACGWRGRLSSSHTQMESTCIEVLCGDCSEALSVVWFPTQAEAMAAGDESTVTMFKCMETRGERFKRECLSSPDQLPEIAGDEITITWDTVERTDEIPDAYTYFKHGDSVLFRELALFESGWRYAQVAAIFRQRYGDRLKDIVPTWGGWLYLGGDSSRLLREAQEVRETLFLTPAVPATQIVMETFAPRPYEPLSPEERAAVLHDWKTSMEEGFCQAKIEDSLLGLDWSLFETRTFPEHDGDTSFWNPPEFISSAFSTLDAYATAMLAAHFPRGALGVLNFTCRLEKDESGSSLRLKFVTTPERGNIKPDTATLELLELLPALLQVKGIEPDAIYYLEGEGCPMQFEYPGSMVVKASPFLRNRPLDLWPQVTLRIAPTEELVRRAQTIVKFLRDPASMDGNPS